MMKKKDALLHFISRASINAYHGYSFLKIKINNTCSFQLENIMHINIERQLSGRLENYIYKHNYI